MPIIKLCGQLLQDRKRGHHIYVAGSKKRENVDRILFLCLLNDFPFISSKKMAAPNWIFSLFNIFVMLLASTLLEFLPIALNKKNLVCIA